MVVPVQTLIAVKLAYLFELINGIFESTCLLFGWGK